MTRIAYINPALGTGIGGGTHAREFLKALTRHPAIAGVTRWPASVARPEAPQSPSRQSKRRAGQLRMLLGYLRPRPALTATLLRVCANPRVDAVILRHGLTLSGAYAGFRRGWRPGPWIVEVNALLFDEWRTGQTARGLLRHEVRRLRLADGVTVVSNYLRDRLIDLGLPREMICVNHNGVDPLHFAPASSIARQTVRDVWKIPRDGFVFGYVGGMEPFRRLPEMIRMMAAWRRTAGLPIQLHIVGDGPDMPAVRDVVAQLTDASWIRFAGVVPYADVPAYMAGFDAALFPFSNPYGSPQKLFEYLAMEIPTLGPDVPAVREVFEHRRHLWLIDQRGSDFQEALQTLVNDRAMTHAMAREGRRHVLAGYTWDHNAARLVAFLRRLTAVDKRQAVGNREAQ